MIPVNWYYDTVFIIISHNICKDGPMLVDNITMFAYLAAFIICVVVLVFLYVVLKRKDKGKRETAGAMAVLTANIAVITAVYFIIQYVINVDCNIGIQTVVRALDAIVFAGIPCSLALLIYANAGSVKPRRLMTGIIAATIVRMVWSSCVNIFSTDQYYDNIGEKSVLSVAVYCAATLVVMGLLLIMIMTAKRNRAAYVSKIFFMISFLCIFAQEGNMMLWQLEEIPGAHFIKYMYPVDTACLLIISIVLAIALKRSHLTDNPLKEITKEDIGQNIDAIASKYDITKREREIVEYIYDGMSNAEIADKTFISINTVKHHIYNVFDKTGVSSRIELIAMINRR